jgi:hypothetical protein
MRNYCDKLLFVIGYLLTCLGAAAIGGMLLYVAIGALKAALALL